MKVKYHKKRIQGRKHCTPTGIKNLIIKILNSSDANNAFPLESAKLAKKRPNMGKRQQNNPGNNMNNNMGGKSLLE
jgi:hypothetical protein